MLFSLAGLVLGYRLVGTLGVHGGCKLHVTAGDDASVVGQISSGQVRAGEGIVSAAFILGGGSLTDSQERGCWWTPPTKIWQCDEGQIPEEGFTVGCDGTVSFNGQATFYECEAEGGRQFDISLEPSGSKCKEVRLKADGCEPVNCDESRPKPPSPPPPSPPLTLPSASASPSSQPRPQPWPGICPTNLEGQFEFPHIIIPVDKGKPDHASSTSFFGHVSGGISSIFNFDIPLADSGKKCSLVFLFPKLEDLDTSSYTLSGNGSLHFMWLEGAVGEGTTYNNKPGAKKNLGTRRISPGGSYSLATFECPAGRAVAFEIMAEGGLKLRYFQDYNPSPIGLYITVC